MKAYPLRFEPILKEKVWGGRRLAELGKPLPDGVLIGESWELADLPESIPGGRSTVANGPLVGTPLPTVIEAEQETIMGPVGLSAEGGFPLLVKYLDAVENLSVQVHPDEGYAERHPEAHLKSEAWVVIQADPGAVIYKGVRPDVSPEAFKAHIGSEQIVHDLVAVPAAPGDCHYLASGTCHALGAGVVVAEVQTPSDTTFRVYDWGRSGRELHIEPALECIRFGEQPDARTPEEPVIVGSLRTTPLTRCAYFTIERIEARAATSLEVVTSGEPVVWMVLAGGGRIETPGAPDVALDPGATVLMPAGLEGAAALLDSGTSFLRITTRSALDGLLA